MVGGRGQKSHLSYFTRDCVARPKRYWRLFLCDVHRWKCPCDTRCCWCCQVSRSGGFHCVYDLQEAGHVRAGPVGMILPPAHSTHLRRHVSLTLRSNLLLRSERILLPVSARALGVFACSFGTWARKIYSVNFIDVGFTGKMFFYRHLNRMPTLVCVMIFS